jgi:hypothetical protein
LRFTCDEDDEAKSPRIVGPFGQLARFDIFAMTSWERPCPLVALENMGLGTPVVCFAAGAGLGRSFEMPECLSPTWTRGAWLG